MLDCGYYLVRRHECPTAGASIFLAISDAGRGSGERPGLRQQAEAPRQGDLELRRGEATRVGDDLQIDVVSQVEARRQRRAPSGRLVGAEDAKAAEAGRGAEIAERVAPASAAKQRAERRGTRDRFELGRATGRGRES